LDLRTRLSRCFTFDLVAGYGSFNAGVHAPAIGTEVGVPVRGDEKEAALFCPIDPVFELAGLTGEAVEVVTH